MNKKDIFKEYFNNCRKANDIDPNIWLSKYLVDRMEMNKDQVIWFCFLQAVTYHLPTAYLIFNEYPDSYLAGTERLREWWTRDTQLRCPYQTDKLKQRKYLPETVESYQKVIGLSDSKYFDELLNGSPSENFDILWEQFYKTIAHFGRFSVWNFAQNLKQIAGYEIEPDRLFLGDSDAESITHGMCHYVGWEDKTYKKRWKTPEGKKRKEVYSFSKPEKIVLENSARFLMKDLDTDGFDLETMLCAYKKLFRNKDSRYTGYYLDRQAMDINKIEAHGWFGIPWYLLYQARNEVVNCETEGVVVDKSRYPEEVNIKIILNVLDT